MLDQMNVSPYTPHLIKVDFDFEQSLPPALLFHLYYFMLAFSAKMKTAFHELIEILVVSKVAVIKR